MFQSLTQNFNKIFDRIRSSGTLSQAQIEEAMRDIRVALLEADVALPVVKDFIESVKEKATGAEIIKSVSPGQMVIKIIHDELVNILSSAPLESSLNIIGFPANILMVGLQGSGKTTASGKLALRLKNQNKKVLLVSLDTYRPAAKEQLEKLAKSIEVDSLPIIADEKPLNIVKRAIAASKLSGYEVVIYDTAGRLHIDEDMIAEVVSIKDLVKPSEVILVADSMTGQAAVAIAENFDKALNITGVILSRIDGDARGGAALSIKHVTNKPIKFLSTGEKLTALEEFHPSRIASRILDMGDIISLVEQAEQVIDREEAEKAAIKLKSGKFDLNDYILQLKQIKKLGGLGNIMGMLPGIGKLMNGINSAPKLPDKLLVHQEAIILSMTQKERKNPMILNGARRMRIARGSGTSVQQVNILLKQFRQMSDMVKAAGSGKFNPKSLMQKAIGRK